MKGNALKPVNSNVVGDRRWWSVTCSRMSLWTITDSLLVSVTNRKWIGKVETVHFPDSMPAHCYQFKKSIRNETFWLFYNCMWTLFPLTGLRQMQTHFNCVTIHCETCIIIFVDKYTCSNPNNFPISSSTLWQLPPATIPNLAPLVHYFWQISNPEINWFSSSPSSPFWQQHGPEGTDKQMNESIIE
jgi:hypothetical protein